MDYYNYFKSFMKPKLHSDQDVRDYYYQYFKSSMKQKPDEKITSPVEVEDKKVEDVEPVLSTVKKDEEIKPVLFAKAPEEIKARKRHGAPTSSQLATKKVRPAEEAKKLLYKKYPALNKF
jgi:hypothetical protein